MATASSTSEAAATAVLSQFAARVDNSWVQQLSADPEQDKHAPNKKSRQVFSGHYVVVKPSPLPDPALAIFSHEMVAELGLTPEACETPEFARLFSGDTDAVPGFETTWATPYALSIYGEEMTHNCPYGTGNGYGDGRAITLGEVVVPSPSSPEHSPKRWEMQLKGGGTTPFCRRADGRAVLRSSVREFLASEAMHALGVSTTRALSLVVSQSETVQRPWYSAAGPQPTIDEATMATIPEHLRPLLMQQLEAAKREPNVMMETPAAITCRVAPSFTRVGHVELFGRRYRNEPNATTRKQLEQIINHAIFREFPEINDALPLPEDTATPEGRKQMQARGLALLDASAKNIAKLTADWIRVGFCQGNFNSDNCLVGGRTMDYGPFGFIERYQPLWNMWVGGGRHFGFRNQPTAGAKNFGSLANAVKELMDQEGEAEVDKLKEHYETLAVEAENDVWRRKLGLAEWSAEANVLMLQLSELMERTRPDYTLLWRQLYALARDRTSAQTEASAAADNTSGRQAFDAYLADTCFYDCLGPDAPDRWSAWLDRWWEQFQSHPDPAARVETMRLSSPKYVPREWMLVHAYEQAHFGHLGPLRELHQLFKHPYDEQPEFEERFYRKAPEDELRKGGTAFMT